MASSSSGWSVAAAVGPVVVLGLLSKVAVGPGPSYGSSEAGLLNIFIISCDMPIGLFGAVELDGVADLADGCEPVRALDDDVLLGAVAGDVGLADVCGPVRALEEVLGAVGAVVGKKLSDVSMTGENLIFVCLASLHDSFSSLSSSEL